LFGIISNLLFPSKHICLICKENYGHNRFICDNCQSSLEVVHEEIHSDSKYIKKVYYSLFYNRFIRELIKKYKFNGKNYLYKAFGEILVETIEKNNLSQDIDMVTYVPSHRRKEALRGYNQAELLARYIAEKIEKPLCRENLVKTKWTEEQSHSNKADRVVNLRDSFHLKKPEKIQKKRILLVDDLITTGATMEECGKILIRNGAKEIIGLALTSSKNN